MPITTTRPFAPPEPAKPPSSQNPITRASTFLGYFRWAFMPLGLFALVAVGVHAAADTVDDRILWVVDHLDAALDALFGAWKVTEPLVNLVGIEERTVIARALTLIWELAADLVIALPALGYREEDAPDAMKRISFATRPRTWKQLFLRFKEQPTAVRVIRPLATFFVVLAGASAVARMVQGALYLSLREGIAGDEFAGPFARLFAIVALVAVCGTFGWRAVLRNLQRADRISDEHAKTKISRFSAGLVGSLIILPIALAALVDATPLLSFFR